MPEVGMLDLAKDPTYVTEIVLGDGKTKLKVTMSRKDGEGKVQLEVNHKDKEPQILEHADLCRLMKDLLMGFYLSTEMKAEYIPQEIRHNIRQAARWAQQQGAMILPMMMSNFLDVETINGKPFAIDLGYAPNITLSGLMDSLGRKKEQWDGSFRPVIHLTEMQPMPEYVGAQLEPVT